jgi:hypothetical protein
MMIREGKMEISAVNRIGTPLCAWTKMAVFTMKLFPMLPSKPIDWVTPKPIVEKVTYPTHNGSAVGDLYRPAGKGPYRAILVCLGVVPFATDHPQVPRLGEALARAGFAALLYWSPAMRDLRLVPDDVENIALAYEWLLAQPYVDPGRSGLLGTCVGGAFSLMAAASPRIRDRVSFVTAYAPFSSVRTLLQDAASSSTVRSENRETWHVDQLTRKVLIRSLIAELEIGEAEQIQRALDKPGSDVDTAKLSAAGRTIYSILSHPEAEEAQSLIAQLPSDFLARLETMSPLASVHNIRAPLIILLHDKGDSVIPVGESRRLIKQLSGRIGVHYKELQFQHLNPYKLPVFRLVRELARFYTALYPLFS